MDPNITITWQHAVVFLGGIALQYLATKLQQPAPAVPTLPPQPAAPPSAPVVAPQLGDGHVLKELLQQLINALQQSTPVAPAKVPTATPGVQP